MGFLAILNGSYNNFTAKQRNSSFFRKDLPIPIKIGRDSVYGYCKRNELSGIFSPLVWEYLELFKLARIGAHADTITAEMIWIYDNYYTPTVRIIEQINSYFKALGKKK